MPFRRVSLSGAYFIALSLVALYEAIGVILTPAVGPGIATFGFLIIGTLGPTLFRLTSQIFVIAVLTLALLAFVVVVKGAQYVSPISYIAATTLILAASGARANLEGEKYKYWIYLYLISGILIDILFAIDMLRDSITGHFSYIGASVDSTGLPPGTSDRRYFEILDHRAFGFVLDPLSWSLILNFFAFARFYARASYTVYIFLIVLVFLLTESRIGLLFSAGLVFSYVFIMKYKSLLIIVLLYLSSILIWLVAAVYFRTQVLSNPAFSSNLHLRGFALADLNSDIFWGLTSRWFTPAIGYESGYIFLLSGVGILSFLLILYWLYLISRISVRSPLLASAALVLLGLMPVHYYFFNAKTLASFALISMVFPRRKH